MAIFRLGLIVGVGMVWALGGCGDSDRIAAGPLASGTLGPSPGSDQEQEASEPSAPAMSAAGGSGATLPPSPGQSQPSDTTAPIKLASDPTVEPLDPFAADGGSHDAGPQQPAEDEPDPADPASVDPPALDDPAPTADAPDAGQSGSIEPLPDLDPPSVEPPDLDPPVTDPPVTEPPVTDPPVTDPPVTDPPVADPPDNDPPAVEPPAPIVPSFEADVWPIFKAGCGTCHTTLRRGGHSVGSPTLATALADARRLGATLIERLDGGGMPPACSGSPGDVGCISVPNLATISLWIDTGMAP